MSSNHTTSLPNFLPHRRTRQNDNHNKNNNGSGPKNPLPPRDGLPAPLRHQLELAIAPN